MADEANETAFETPAGLRDSQDLIHLHSEMKGWRGQAAEAGDRIKKLLITLHKAQEKAEFLGKSAQNMRAEALSVSNNASTLTVD